MCLTPVRLDDGGKVACRNCGICKNNRINDLIGRCIAEQSTSSSVLAVTLTYAGDGTNSVILQYRDVQIMLKRLRNDGFKVRYICAGEYGTKKGRAHWHIILFFKGKAPSMPLEQRVEWLPYWEHGFAYFQNPDYKGFKYVMKYALKQDGSDGRAKSLSMSKKPPLGYHFFIALADDLVERRLPVHTPSYSFMSSRRDNGEIREYWLQGRMREMFLDHYHDEWVRLHGEEPPQTEWLVEQYYDPKIRKQIAGDPGEFERKLDARRAEFISKLANKPAEIPTYTHQIGFLMLDGYDGAMVVAYSDYTAEVLLKGQPKWQLHVDLSGHAALLARQLEMLPLSATAQTAVSRWLQSRFTRFHTASSRQGSPNRHPSDVPSG